MNSTPPPAPRKVGQNAAPADKSAGAKLKRTSGAISSGLRQFNATRVAPISNAGLTAVNWAERNGVSRLGQYAILRYALKGSPIGQAIAIALKALPVVDRPVAAAGSYVATMARKDNLPDLVQSRQPFMGIFNKNQSFALFRSSLTPMLNKRDVMVPAKQIKSSSGATVNIRGKTWHQGTTTFTTDDGRERTICHIQSLSLPSSQHYYFDRPLSNKEFVDVAGGSGRHPGKMNGFIGQVSQLEGLANNWSAVKQAAIKNRIHHPPPDRRPGERAPQTFLRIPGTGKLEHWADKAEHYNGMLVDIADQLGSADSPASRLKLPEGK